MPALPRTRTANVVRTVLWIVASTAFLYSNWHRIAIDRAHGIRPSAFSWFLLGVWMVALLFWLSVGWRDWTRRNR